MWADEWVPIKQAVEDTGISSGAVNHYIMRGFVETRMIENPDRERFGRLPTIKGVRVRDVVTAKRDKVMTIGDAGRDADVCHDVNFFVDVCGMRFSRAVRHTAEGYRLDTSTVLRIYRASQGVAA